MKIGLVSLGCAKNLVDSEMVLGLVKEKGYEVTPYVETADLIIINTCGFIQSAKEEAIATIFEYVSTKENNQKIMVIGCLATRYKEELIKEIPEVDCFVSIKEYSHLGEIIDKLMGVETISNTLCFDNRILSTPPFTAYVRIGDGCDNNCHYCAIPLIRGGFKSRSIEDVVKECNYLVHEKGIKELVLIAQDTTRFGVENHESIEELLKEVLKIDVKMVRLLYLYPDEISDELLDIFANNTDKLAPYFDIPIQHASNKILEAMNRRGTKEHIRNIINKIREKVPTVVLRTTVMVGFPGETEEDYQELEDFIKEIKFDRLGCFTYSPEEDTVGYTLPQIDQKIKDRRLDRLMKVQSKIAYELSKQKIGNVYECFVEDYDPEQNLYKCRSYAFSGDDVDGFIYVKSHNTLEIGDVITVKITGASIYDLMGEIVK